MRMYDLIDENNVLFDKQTIRRYNNNNKNNNHTSHNISSSSSSTSHNRQDLNNNQNSTRRRNGGALFKSSSFSHLHRKIINNITPNLTRRGQQDKDMAGVSLMSTTSSAYQKNGAGRLKKKYSGPDILMERRKSLKGMTRYVLKIRNLIYLFFFFLNFQYFDNFIVIYLFIFFL